MEENADNTLDPEWLKNLPLRSEEIGFPAEELIACGECGRRSAPDRPACMYCGAAINSSASGRLEIREVESWENGYNVVVMPIDGSDNEAVACDLESVLRLSRELIAALLLSGKPFPIARAGTAEQASAISHLLTAHNLRSWTIRDSDLLLQAPPVRLRSLVFDGDNLRLNPFTDGDATVLHTEDLALLVSCVLLTERRESTEQKKRRSVITVDESNVSSDQPVIDIYSRTDPTGWRIPVNGFDFSTLGDEKSLLAHENMRRMAQRLREFASSARFVDDYLSVRSVLEVCWPTEHRKDTRAPRLVTFGPKKTTSVFTTDNTVQVTKYSRLQWHLL